MRIAVLGSGGLGGFLGGALAKAGHDVSFIARGKQLEALRDGGLELESVALGRFQLTVKAAERPSDVGQVDLVLFTVKSYDTERALEEINPLIGRETTVLTFQNGVDNHARIAEAVGASHVLAGVISVESYVSAPGKISQTTGPMGMAVGEINGEITLRSKNVQDAFVKSGLKCELTDRIEVLLWEKFLFICAVGGVCSVTRSSLGEVLAFEPSRRLFISVMKEVEAVARAKSIDLPEDIVERTLKQSEGVRKEMKPSMLRDLELGKRLEVDSLNGTVSRLGHQVSVPTPVNDFIYASLKLQEMRSTSDIRREMPSSLA